MKYYKDIKFHNGGTYTVANNLVVGDVLVMIGLLVPKKLTITEFTIVDIDYNNIKDTIIFEFDTELYPIVSKYWSSNINTEVKMHSGKAKALQYSLDPNEDIGGWYTNWSSAGDRKIKGMADKIEWETKQEKLLLKGESNE